MMSEKDKSKTDQEVDYSLISNFIFIYIAVIAIIMFLKSVDEIEEWVQRIEPYVAPGVTLFVFLYTTTETRRIQKANKAETKRIQDENKLNIDINRENDRINSIKPIIVFDFPFFMSFKYNKSKHELDITYDDTKNLAIKNLSNNIARDVKVHIFPDEDTFTNSFKKFYGDTLSKNKTKENFIYTIDKSVVAIDYVFRNKISNYLKYNCDESLYNSFDTFFKNFSEIFYKLYTGICDYDNAENFNLMKYRLTLFYKNAELKGYYSKYILNFIVTSAIDGEVEMHAILEMVEEGEIKI